MRLIMLGLFAVFAVAGTGCGTIVNGSRQQVPIETTPPGAKVSIIDQRNREVAFLTTPAVATLPRGAGFLVPARYVAHVTKPGYLAIQFPIVGHLDPYYYGNILFSGPVGLLIVDPISGGMYTLTPTQSKIELMRSAGK